MVRAYTPRVVSRLAFHRLAPTLFAAALTLSCSSASSGGDPAVDSVGGDGAPDLAAGDDLVPAPDAGDDAQSTGDDASPDDTGGDDVPDLGGDTDTGPAAKGTPGDSCTLDSDCAFADGTCLDWAGGYCTRLNCELGSASGCPEGSACAAVSAGVTACLATCEGTCREGYGCKRVGDASVCVGLTDSPSPPGGPCTTTPGCAGSGTCLGASSEGPPAAGGYCATVGCDVLSCDAGTACVLYNGTASCLVTCSTTDECLIAGATERSCGALPRTGPNAPAGIAKVCLPSGGGTSVGGGCTQDLECDTGTCRIVAKGKCVGSSLGCFTDADCPGGTVCELAPAYERGVCTLACGEDVACPGKSACAPAVDGSAYCQLPCNGASDVLSCDAALGEVCRFGDPLASTASGGKYLCVVEHVGDPGSSCTADGDCKAGTCLGTCAPTCAETACPFGTTCVDHAGTPRCLKRCFSPADCPGKGPCALPVGSAIKVCTPPQ